MIALTKESFKEQIKYNKGCDVSGSFTVIMEKFFPVSLKFRNIKSYHTLNAKFKFEIVFTDQMILHVFLKETTLIGKNRINFSANYKAAIDPLNQKQFIQKRLGGKIIVSKINNKKISKTIELN